MKVINGKKDGFIGKDIIYIGRYNHYYSLSASPLANKYKVKEYGSLEIVLKKYKEWLYIMYISKQGPAYEELIKLVKLHEEGKEIKLACWCKPKRCHGDIIKQVVEFIVEYKKSKNKKL